METIKKYVIIGPESTGKSTLCAALARHYQTSWVAEYAREYLEKNGMNYTYEDLLTIAKGQLELEEAVSGQVTAISNQLSAISDQQSAISNQQSAISDQQSAISDQPLAVSGSRLLFIDTDMYVMKVWCEFVFNKCHNWILNRIAERKYDGYLLCNTDLPWVPDNLREYPDEENRKKLYHFYKDLLAFQHIPWVSISGNYEERLETAIDFIEQQNNS